MPSADLSARIAEEAATLPPEKQSTVLDFVLFVKQQGTAPLSDENGDTAWERIINDPTPRPKLAAFIEGSIAEGSELLDPSRL